LAAASQTACHCRKKESPCSEFPARASTSYRAKIEIHQSSLAEYHLSS